MMSFSLLHSMKTPSLLVWSGLLLAGVILPSCQRDITVAPNNVAIGTPATQDIQANYPGFDWDNPATTTMPASASSPTVYVPWRSNGGTPLDAGIVDDYHKSDGWELVYNSFAPDNFPNSGNTGAVATSGGQPAGGLYFALYNRYRGILRYYLYIPPGLFSSSTQIAHGLQIYTSGNTSKMLNFEGVDIVDPSLNTRGFTKTNKDGVSTTGGWYAMQYQIAYDPTFASTVFPNPGFRWDSYSTSVTQINLNGVEEGTIKGTITTPTPDFNWSDLVSGTNIVNAALTAVEVYGTFGLASAEGKYGKAFSSAASGGLAGNTTGLLSGIFGGNSANSQTVDLTLNSTITTTGTATTNQPYELNAMPFPGQQVSNTNAVPPLITHAIGLFNLSARPTVTLQVTRATSYDGNVTPGYADYQVDARLIEKSLLQLNPSVFNSNADGATYRNFKAEIVAFEPGNWVSPNGVAPEIIGNHTAYTAPNGLQLQNNAFRTPPTVASNVGIRISFTVVPNNSNTPTSFIVKTFQASVVNI